MEWTKLSTNEIKMVYKVNGLQGTARGFFYIEKKNKTHQNDAKTVFQFDQYT